MNKGLLKYLKSSIDRNWLQDFSLASYQQDKARKNSSLALYQLTQAKIAQIRKIETKKSRKPVVFVVEDNPVNLIAAFLAGVITEVNLFLCDPAWQLQEWQQVLNLIQPDLIFGNQLIASLILELNSSKQNLPVLVNNTQMNLSYSSLIMIPTGGSSGKIRFAMHNWSTLAASVRGFTHFFDCYQINSFCTLPLYHVSGLMQVMRSLLTQGNLIICPYKLIPTQPIKVNKSEYFISLVPSQLQFLLEYIPDWLTGFKTVLIGGAPSRRSLLNTAREYNIAIALTYGMTETASGVIALKPQDFLAGNNSSGQVLPHAQLSISNILPSNAANQERRELQPKERKSTEQKTGLIEIYSTSLCLGYYPQLFTPTQPFITDDLGFFDDDGYLHLVGRDSQKIISGGENVFPHEVEAVINATNLVKDVWVLGISDPRWGEAVTAIYVPNTSADDNLNLIKQQIKSQLAKYKQPKNWIKVDCVPRNNRGKVNYQQLKAIALQTINNRL